MKHTEEEIVEKAKKVMKDFRGKYYSDKSIGKADFWDKKEFISGKNEGKSLAVWNISINALFDNIDFLFISDETGEPIYYMNFNTIPFDIEKTTEGKYYRVGIKF